MASPRSPRSRQPARTGQAVGAVRYSLVLPIFNEAEVMPQLLARVAALLDRLDGPGEAIFVDDGSTDGGASHLAAAMESEPRFRLIRLSRNFGHQIAITAGMDAAEGEAVVVMDADLQDPPELVLDLIAKWAEGYEIVYARRVRRQGETWFKRATANLFYRLLGTLTPVAIPRDVGDFRLIGRKALETFRDMPEHDRFVRGMFAWMGFRQAGWISSGLRGCMAKPNIRCAGCWRWRPMRSSASPTSRCAWCCGWGSPSRSWRRCTGCGP